MGRSPGFASTTCDWIALLRLAFATATHLKCLTLPQTVTRRLIMRKARSHPFPSRRKNIGLLQLVSVWFQLLFTPLIGVVFIFRSLYFSLSVAEKYLALEGGPPSFTRSSTSSVLLWYADGNGGHRYSHTGLSPTMVGLSRPFCLPCLCNSSSAPATPKSMLFGLGYIRFRSPLLTESRLISFPAGTEMFQFPAFASHGLYIQPWMTGSGCPVPPGYPIRKSRD